MTKAIKRSQILVKLIGNLDQGETETLMAIDFGFCKSRSIKSRSTVPVMKTLLAV